MQIHNQTINGGTQYYADTMTNNFNSLQQSNASDEVKELFARLFNEIKGLGGEISAKDMAIVAEDAEDLMDEVNSPTPRKEIIWAKLGKMTDTAKQWGEKAAPYVTILEAILLLPF